MLRVVYFASVREALGCDGEDHLVPETVSTIGDFIDHLCDIAPCYHSAFADRSKLRFALDAHMAKADAVLGDAAELAVFPPVTGG
ncbi:MoaD/ThiS family protein [Sphingorhabdus sp.]|jgi:molybdopterin synthase sulfur carrier subunit|uniref:MoaD/ThiS family protein n=1 Tax=Sphingorhabdus sp. TaxID=1902408 RepID=UPI003BAE4C49|nr:MoaD/ThiS family protein [Sphingomonadales bacterium]MBL0021234.1 MoaD/ThiS family protein [Sphingomonadales bacterium]